MAKILVIRFSALGDVAMTVPVVYSLARQYPQHQITFLSRSFCAPMFSNMPNNVHFKGVDLQKEYRGFFGLNRLYNDLKKENFDIIADLHGVIRTHFLCLRFFMAGKSVASIHKGRKEKRQLTSLKHKKFYPLKTSFERYHDVFLRLRLPFNLNFKTIYNNIHTDYMDLFSIVGEKKIEEKWIGIAPFAKHQGKIYPLSLMEKIIAKLVLLPNIRIFLFGGGKEEEMQFNKWCSRYSNLTSVAGLLRMPMELKLMSKLELMVSMDSANMHLASLVNTPVISIWGATHPYAGFMGWGQSEKNALQVELPCRPCSVFGQKPCVYGNYPCMLNINPDVVTETILNFIKG